MIHSFTGILLVVIALIYVVKYMHNPDREAYCDEEVDLANATCRDRLCREHRIDPLDVMKLTHETSGTWDECYTYLRVKNSGRLSNLNRKWELEERLFGRVKHV